MILPQKFVDLISRAYMKRSTNLSLTFFPLDFMPQELHHRDQWVILHLDQWSDGLLRCSRPFRFPPLGRSPVLCSLALASYRSQILKVCAPSSRGTQLIVTTCNNEIRLLQPSPTISSAPATNLTSATLVQLKNTKLPSSVAVQRSSHLQTTTPCIPNM